MVLAGQDSGRYAGFFLSFQSSEREKQGSTGRVQDSSERHDVKRSGEAPPARLISPFKYAQVGSLSGGAKPPLRDAATTDLQLGRHSTTFQMRA
jgi:hypothetical protein